MRPVGGIEGRSPEALGVHLHRDLLGPDTELSRGALHVLHGQDAPRRPLCLEHLAKGPPIARP